MDQKAALKFIDTQSKRGTWADLAHQIGEKPYIVYGWWRRGRVPQWRVPAVEAAAKRMQRAEA